MAFRLEQRPIAKQLRRLVRKELDAAIDGLDVGDASALRIHDARKHIKKARAIVKLLRGPLGKSYARQNERLRAAGRPLRSCGMQRSCSRPSRAFTRAF